MTPTGLPDAMPDGSPIGWYVTDPQGNVVDYGGVTVVELVSSSEGA
jgi:hypothetical protein